MSFTSFGLRAELVRGVENLGFQQPTPIQQDAIPAALAGRDVLATSATGSGKTAAFVLPILNRLAALPRGQTRALIVSPTRELAAQIGQHLADLARHTDITHAVICGGMPMEPQRQAITRKVDVLIATPGRMLDHLSYSYAKLHDVDILVLDEADRMLDMGFLPDVRRLIGYLPEQGMQTLLFSATLPPEIVRLTKQMLNNPVRINVEREARPVAGVTQTVYPVPHALKSALLLRLLESDEIRNALVFARTKRRADRVADYLKRNGVHAARIHGDRTQSQRTQALEGFKRGRYRVLVATDIAARGIDIEALSHVINFDLPNCPEDYIHRIGRTARAEATGDAFTLVSPDQEGDLRAIERDAVSSKLARVTLPDFDYTEPERERFGGAGRGRDGIPAGEGAPRGPWKRHRRGPQNRSSRPWEHIASHEHRPASFAGQPQ